MKTRIIQDDPADAQSTDAERPENQATTEPSSSQPAPAPDTPVGAG
jgi:hypothetical protein